MPGAVPRIYHLLASEPFDWVYKVGGIICSIWEKLKQRDGYSEMCPSLQANQDQDWNLGISRLIEALLLIMVG